jgi:hypothetical protein
MVVTKATVKSSRIIMKATRGWRMDGEDSPVVVLTAYPATPHVLPEKPRPTF